MPYADKTRQRAAVAKASAALRVRREAERKRLLALARALAAADPPISAEAARDAARQALGVSQTTGE